MRWPRTTVSSNAGRRQTPRFRSRAGKGGFPAVGAVGAIGGERVDHEQRGADSHGSPVKLYYKHNSQTIDVPQKEKKWRGQAASPEIRPKPLNRALWP